MMHIIKCSLKDMTRDQVVVSVDKLKKAVPEQEYGWCVDFINDYKGFLERKSIEVYEVIGNGLIAEDGVYLAVLGEYLEQSEKDESLHINL